MRLRGWWEWKYLFAIALVPIALTGCDAPSPRNPLLGKWFNNEKNSVIEFKENGIFGFSNSGILTLGSEWLVVDRGRVRIQVRGLGAPPPEVCNYEIVGDTLRFSACSMPTVWTRVRGQSTLKFPLPQMQGSATIARRRSYASSPVGGVHIVGPRNISLGFGVSESCHALVALPALARPSTDQFTLELG